MREYRLIAVLTGLLLLVVVVYFVERSLAPGAGEFDELASARIGAACAYKPECKVQVGELAEGDWDTLWEFGSGVSQAELEAALPGRNLHRRDLERLVVLTRLGRVTGQFNEPYDAEAPLEHQLVFTDGSQNQLPVVHYSHDAWLWATPQTVDASGRRYYRLDPDNR